ncbi:hypothetical protein B0H34DRAFT_785794 [Crassisporium funariophilum]|nr:hypothetical protein B0H34DRAFT_785794 [Crassisporium funariophilum]
MESPWDDDATHNSFQDIEWSRMSSEFTNVGYREGITAGKESALQEGFDAGFAQVGAPIGRQLGILRGMASAILALLNSSAVGDDQESIMPDIQDIAGQLSKIRFSDIMPRDVEAEEHARQHLEEEGVEIDIHEKIAAKRDIEGLEDMLANLTSGTNLAGSNNGRPSMDDLDVLKTRLIGISRRLDLGIVWN